MPTRLQNVILQDHRIVFRNFSGAEGRFNPKGRRNFNVILTDDEAVNMERDGWNVKYLQPREEDQLPTPRLEISVHYSERATPPTVVLITSRGKTRLTEDMLPILDWCEIANVDMILRPYEWEVNGKTGVKAYLKSIYVTIVEDALELKYADVPELELPDSAQNSIGIGEIVEDDQLPAGAIRVQSEIVGRSAREIESGIGETPF